MQRGALRASVLARRERGGWPPGFWASLGVQRRAPGACSNASLAGSSRVPAYFQLGRRCCWARLELHGTHLHEGGGLHVARIGLERLVQVLNKGRASGRAAGRRVRARRPIPRLGTRVWRPHSADCQCSRWAFSTMQCARQHWPAHGVGTGAAAGRLTLRYSALSTNVLLLMPTPPTCTENKQARRRRKCVYGTYRRAVSARRWQHAA